MVVHAMKTASTKAFTLVELIVVITILAILATIGFLSLQGYTGDAKNTAIKANLKSVAETMVNESALASAPISNYVNGTGSTLSSTIAVYSGTVVTAGSSYFAGTVNYTALRLDPNKFQPAGKEFLAGVVGITEGNRVRSAFQLAGTITNGSSDTAYVEGTYAEAVTSDADGLVKGTQAPGGTDCATQGNAIVTGKNCLPYTSN